MRERSDWSQHPESASPVVEVSAAIGRPNAARPAILSDRCGIRDLWLPFDPGATAKVALWLRPGWVRRWSAS
jgi:hypothetical protein